MVAATWTLISSRITSCLHTIHQKRERGLLNPPETRTPRAYPLLSDTKRLQPHHVYEYKRTSPTLFSSRITQQKKYTALYLFWLTGFALFSFYLVIHSPYKSEREVTIHSRQSQCCMQLALSWIKQNTLSLDGRCRLTFAASTGWQSFHLPRSISFWSTTFGRTGIRHSHSHFRERRLLYGHFVFEKHHASLHYTSFATLAEHQDNEIVSNTLPKLGKLTLLKAYNLYRFVKYNPKVDIVSQPL